MIGNVKRFGKGEGIGCVALAAEQTLMTTNIEALTARYQAADAAYAAERAKLEEAAASLALAALR